MSDELGDLIRSAGQDLRPDEQATVRARAAVLAAGRSRRGLRRVVRSRRGQLVLVAAAVVLVAGGATATVQVLTRSHGFPYTPAPQNCFALSGYRFVPPRIAPHVVLDERGVATVVWVDGKGRVAAVRRDEAGVWGTPEPLSKVGSVNPTDVALAGNRAGDLAAVWVRDGHAEVAVGHPDGSWDAPRVVSRAGQTPVEAPFDAAVAVGPDGEIAAAWVSVPSSAVRRRTDGSFVITGEPPHIEAAVADATGNWTTQPAFRRRQELAAHPAVAFSRHTPVLAVTGGRSFGALLITQLGQLRNPVTVTAPRGLDSPRGGSVAGPSIAANPAGVVAITWAVNGAVLATTTPDGTASEPARRLSDPGPEVPDPRIAVDDDGTLTATWAELRHAPRPGRPGYRTRAVLTTTRTPTGTWGTPTRVSRPGDLVTAPAVASAAGTTLVWASGTNGLSGRASTVQATTAITPGRWDQPAAISPAGLGPLKPAVATNPEGTAIATWARCLATRRVALQAATRAPTGPWQPATTIATP